MSVNKYQPHVLVLPEDDANRQIANGFLLHPDLSAWRIQVLEQAGGWREVLDRFVADHVPTMERYTNRNMVLMIDFDGRPERLQDATAEIPAHLRERVFVLGALNEPEDLKRDLGSYESIGSALAQDCREKSETCWGHELLRHNAGELERLGERVRPILFPA